MPTPSQPQPTTPLGTPPPTSGPIQPPSVRRPPPANSPPGFRPIARQATANIIFAAGGRVDFLAAEHQDRRFWPITAGDTPTPAHDTQLAQIRRRNALAREAEHMLAVVKRFKDLCQAGVIVSRTTQAECDRIIAAIEGGAL